MIADCGQDPNTGSSDYTFSCMDGGLGGYDVGGPSLKYFSPSQNDAGNPVKAWYSAPSDGDADKPYPSVDLFRWRHGSRSQPQVNCLFGDGHVGSFSYKPPIDQKRTDLLKRNLRPNPRRD